MNFMTRADHVRAGHWLMPGAYNAQQFGRAKLMRNRPQRHNLLIRQALASLKINYTEHLVLWNNEFHPIWQGQPCSGGYQMFDYVIPRNDDPEEIYFIILANKTTAQPIDKLRWAAKQAHCQVQEIPLLIVPRHYTSQEYMVSIANFVRKVKHGTTTPTHNQP